MVTTSRSDARKQAEEALREWDSWADTDEAEREWSRMSIEAVNATAGVRDALRALLAEQDGAGRDLTADEGKAYGEMLDGVFLPAPSPASDEVFRDALRNIIDETTDYTARQIAEDALAARPAVAASDEVREAADKLRISMDAYGNRVAGPALVMECASDLLAALAARGERGE